MDQQTIKLLPEHVINQIKAGEVIDSPSGILKELIENSIDSGADFISIKIVDNGIEQISITDNGKGMGFNELPLAFARHATSKISDFRDLYKLHSYGFRGEALASLASVAEVKCQTTNHSESSILHLKGPEQVVHEKLENRKKTSGTSIHITNLFFNTPVRLKFLSHQNKEKRLIEKLLNAVMMINPQIEFHVQFDQKEKQIFKSTDADRRIREIFKVSKDQVKYTDNSFEEADLEFTMSNDDSSRAIQNIFINKRLIEDKKIKNIINYTLLNTLGSQKKHWVLQLTLPANQVDINVHPKKTEVRMYKTNLIHSFISKSLKKIIVNSSQSSNVSFTGSKNSPSPTRSSFNFSSHSSPTSFEPKKFKPSNLNSSQREMFSSQPTQQQSFESTSNNHELKVLFSAKDYSLIQSDNQCFVLTKKNLVLFIYQMIMKQKSSIIPLLISAPCQIHPASLKLLDKLDVDTQKISDTEILIKSLPEVLSYFNFAQINEHNHPEELLTELEINQHSLQNLINNFSQIKEDFTNLSELL